MNRIEVRDKLWRVMRDMLLSDLENDREIPEAIAGQILENYGCVVDDKSYTSEDLNDFVKNLQKWVEESHMLMEKGNAKTDEVQFDLDDIFEKYLESEKEYSDVTSELVDTLVETLKYKEKYSEHFKSLCKFESGNVDVLNEKVEFIKLKLFLKFYGEGNALKSHLKLREALQQELKTLQKTYNEVVELNKQYDSIKNDKRFCELLQMYEDLKRVESYTDIIGEL